jgi:hypothetical protein
MMLTLPALVVLKGLEGLETGGAANELVREFGLVLLATVVDLVTSVLGLV